MNEIIFPQSRIKFLIILILGSLLFTYLFAIPRFILLIPYSFLIITFVFLVLMFLTFFFYRKLKKGKQVGIKFLFLLCIILLIFNVDLFIRLYNIESFLPGANFFMLFMFGLPLAGVNLVILKKLYFLRKHPFFNKK
ncbi:hypothetical protein A3I25_01480 [Candidatus Nomurabacteria bacterium RIFCSPLOWO2_02_FULL_42_17]|uniref:Uncharacterized protein n=2 Tax=Candidatus Nomuraibacteriota TaxID=1752729 RepID=A0A1F6WLS2_9BACT|nr:MAG: hypothetical protein UV08_C0008G0010 [Parcubacteria group bacterium GW2011_GWA2_42_18]OGI82829.1 MAG: hypothetical protein A3B93_00285 [Candidatus Nomurabacteria bacterium RIFCSPHIGHO2_02_FULL_42_24]OGI96810.1 MAG: hypothetical protein A3I25_01480 [Candidatus Nomurabacteria bacterium RIFCSPLOWO2_02_FULL_42_17]